VALADRGFDVGITWHEDEDGARSTAQEANYATGASFVIDGGMLLMAAVANQDSEA
jgi:hypothetical protein